MGCKRLFRKEAERFRKLQTGKDRVAAVAEVLHASKAAAERKDLKKQCDALTRAAAFLRAPRPNGDGGRGVTAEEMEEVRNVKRTLTSSLEALDFGVKNVRVRCGFVVAHI